MHKPCNILGGTMWLSFSVVGRKLKKRINHEKHERKNNLFLSESFFVVFVVFVVIKTGFKV